MEKQIVEKLIEIATRVKGKGDTWEIQGFEKNQTSLTDALEVWYEIATVKPKAFRLELSEGKLYAIINNEVEVKPVAPKKFNMYGDY